MPEVAIKKFKFIEMVPKGKGFRSVEGEIKCTANGAVEIMNLMWLSGRFAIDPASCKKNLTPNQQREAFGLTIAEMEKESAPVEESKPVDPVLAPIGSKPIEPKPTETATTAQDDPLLGSKADHEKHLTIDAEFEVLTSAESKPDAAEPA